MQRQEETLESIWNHVCAWLKARGHDSATELCAGASAEAIAKAEEELGLVLPADFREFLRLHHGARGEFGAIRGHDLQSLNQIVEMYHILKEILRNGDFDDWASRANDAGIQPGHWNEGWVLFTDDAAGNGYALDLSPDEGGKSGQVFEWDETGAGPVIARSFTEFLGVFARELEAGCYEIVDGYLEESGR